MCMAAEMGCKEGIRETSRIWSAWMTVDPANLRDGLCRRSWEVA